MSDAQAGKYAAITVGLDALHRDKRDAVLWAAMPAKSAPYDCQRLSKAETLALTVALSDGFGNVMSEGYQAMELPVGIKSGLLEHSFFVSEKSEYHPEECNYEFWRFSRDCLPASDQFPLGFSERRLRVYFQSQFDRFCAQLKCDDPIEQEWKLFKPQWYFQNEAFKRPYEKPWYEMHALQFLDWIADRDIRKHANLAHLMNTGFAGQLGRLVEQYYWRFRFEEVAMTGTAARTGASAGGRAQAASHRSEHAKWQNAASKIWSSRPDLSKKAVGEQIAKKLKLSLTGKHIARYIIKRR